jgi:hypothetical protein
MSRRILPCLLVTPMIFAAAASSRAQQPADWKKVDAVLGSSGADLPGDVHRFGWPRRDLHVTMGNVTVEPGLALGSWAAFHEMGEQCVAMGDLVLLSSEVEPVLDRLANGSFEILAIHNHLIGESPRVVYLHFHGKGQPEALARTLRAALETTKTPLQPAPAPAAAPPERTRVFDALESALGRKGNRAGAVLQVGVPRRDPIREDGMDLPPAMGMATALNFQAVGSDVATSGDFVLIADEVQPVIRELRAGGIAIEALHSHMLREQPRLFFMHFWGVGSPDKIGHTLAGAIAKTASK